jgi:hypothetical protein
MGTPETGIPETGTPDTGTPDTGTPVTVPVPFPLPYGDGAVGVYAGPVCGYGEP